MIDTSDLPRHHGHQAGRKRAYTQTYNVQLYAPPELAQISVPRGANDINNWSDYYFEEQAGEGVYIYLVEWVSWSRVTITCN